MFLVFVFIVYSSEVTQAIVGADVIPDAYPLRIQVKTLNGIEFRDNFTIEVANNIISYVSQT